MTLIRGKTYVTCPKTNEEVKVHADCVKCEHFSHVSYEGYATVIVACKYADKGD